MARSILTLMRVLLISPGRCWFTSLGAGFTVDDDECFMMRTCSLSYIRNRLILHETWEAFRKWSLQLTVSGRCTASSFGVSGCVRAEHHRPSWQPCHAMSLLSLLMMNRTSADELMIRRWNQSIISVFSQSSMSYIILLKLTMMYQETGDV